MEDTISISDFKIVAFPGVITDAETATQVAEAIGAYGVIWGNYDDDFVNVNVQLGDASQFGEFQFPEEDVREMVDANFRMANERQETLAYAVGGLQTGTVAFTNYDFIEIPITQVILENISEPRAEVMGNRISSWYYRFIIDWLPDPESAAQHMTEAIQLDAGNPVLYDVRAFAHYRNGDLARAREDINTSLELAPESWINPVALQLLDAMYFENDLDLVLQYLDVMAEYAADDWYVYTNRGFAQYLLKNYDAARDDIMRSIENSPDINMPYPAGVSIALRDGDFPRSLAIYREMKERFPDPTLTRRALAVTLPEDMSDFIYAQLNDGFGNMALRRWQAMLDIAEEILAEGEFISADVYFLQGFAHCNLDNYEAAEEAYTEAIALEPDFYMLYFLRAEVRRNTGNLIGATADVAEVLNSDQAEIYQPYLNTSTEDAISCKTMLDQTDEQMRARGVVFFEATEEATAEPE